MLRRTFLGALAVALLALTAAQIHAMPGANDYRVRADLSGKTPASGSVKYRERIRKSGVEQRFDVEVEDAAPGAIMTVQINDLVVGMIVIDEFGRGELQYRTAAFIDDPGDGDPIPDGFPTLLDGDLVSVGPLSGVLEEA